MSNQQLPTTNQAIASVTSEGTVAPGQEHRSSGDFSFPSVPAGTILYQWGVSGSSNDSTVTFDLMQDISDGPDQWIQQGITNGATTPLANLNAGQNNNYYIADPSNNPGNPAPGFIVTLYAVILPG